LADRATLRSVGPQLRVCRARTALAVSILVSALAGCGGSGAEPEEGGAAEPDSAPELTVPPAGDVAEVGSEPQGLVYDPISGTLSVAVREPDRLLVLDPETLRPERDLPLPARTRHLQVVPGGGTVLVPSEGADRVLQVDPASGETTVVATGDYPHDAAAAGNGDLAVAEEFGGSMSVYRDGERLLTFDDLVQPGGVVVEGRTAVVVDVEDDTVTSYDLDALTRVERLTVGEGPTHVASLGDGRVAVTDTVGDAVVVYDVDPLEEVARLPLDGSPYGLAADSRSDTVWVTLTGRNEVVGLDVSGETPEEIDRYPTVRQPDTVAVSPGADAVWVTGRSDGVVQRVER